MTVKKFAKLEDELYERSPESRQRVEREVARLTAELGLAELRTRMQRTQTQIAEAIGTSQSGVSRMEHQHDLLVSTLRDYVAATGGQLRVVAEYPDYEVEVHLPILGDAPGPAALARTFQVVWQNLRTRQFVQVGGLEFTGDRWVFAYTAEAELHPDFQPFPPFPELRRTYESGHLFPFFGDRIAATARRGSDQPFAALGLTRDQATPVELLARSGAADVHATIHIVPEPTQQEDGTETLPFLVSGIRHVDEDNPDGVSERVAALQTGQELDLRDEPDNAFNDQAIQLEAAGQSVGWIPDYLLGYVHKSRQGGRPVRVTVEHANGPETPWHLRLLCQLAVLPEPGYRPAARSSG